MFYPSRKFWKLASFIVTIGIIYLILRQLRLDPPEYHKDLVISKEIIDLNEVNREQLVNFPKFKYKIENNLCKNYDRELLGVLIITSYVGHDELRSAHRQAISQTKLNEMGLIRVFLLAEIPQKEKFITQEQISSEQKRFGDLVQGNFLESYRNLTLKHIMGLKWAALNCQNAKFLIKIDDDIIFDVFQIKNYLETLELESVMNKKNFIAGYILDNKKPIRLKANKWYVSREEFSGDLYPDYISGWLYITTPATALLLVLESQQEKYFWIDDTYVTGILRNKIGIPLIRINKWFSANSEFLDCCVRDLKLTTPPYECEYYVGPNGGDTKLIIEFLHSVEKCYYDECIRRPNGKSLKETCVAAAKNLLKQDHGEPLIREVAI